MLEIFVCDDDVQITDGLRAFILSRFPNEYTVVTFNKCNELFGMIEMNENVPDILIMDINLRDGNGIETVKRLQNTHPDIKVIYLTGVIDYAKEIFYTNPSWFLVKPIEEGELVAALSKVGEQIKRRREDSIVVRSNGQELLLCRQDIMYVESKARVLILYMSDGRENTIYEKMDVLQEQLGSSFVRCHKSFLVNMKYITERINRNFYLTDGKVISISKNNFNETKIKFIKFLGDFQ